MWASVVVVVVVVVVILIDVVGAADVIAIVVVVVVGVVLVCWYPHSAQQGGRHASELAHPNAEATCRDSQPGCTEP